MIDVLLNERTRNRGIFNPEGIKSLLRDEIVNLRNYAMTLVNAVDLELILRLYADGDGFKLFAAQE